MINVINNMVASVSWIDCSTCKKQMIVCYKFFKIPYIYIYIYIFDEEAFTELHFR